MASHIHTANIHELLGPYQVCYEVRPYYVVSEQRPAGHPAVDTKVQAGFDVNLYGALESTRLPLFRSEAAHTVTNYFESAARDIQIKAGHGCTIEVIPDTDSLVLDPRKHFEPEAMLRIRISHDRGLDQPEGPSEELALKATEDLLHELGVKRV